MSRHPLFRMFEGVLKDLPSNTMGTNSPSSPCSEDDLELLPEQGESFDSTESLEMMGVSVLFGEKKRTKAVQENRWEQMFQSLEEFHQREGHCNVPRGWEEDRPLANWVLSQRIKYNRMKKGGTKMNPERIAKLEQLGFRWARPKTGASTASPQSKWEIRFNELRKFKRKHGHCNVPRDWSENSVLASWVAQQRQQYFTKLEGNKRTNMSGSRAKRLEELGFQWTERKTKTHWEARLEELREFKRRHGHCNVPQGDHALGSELGNWVHKQRKAYKKMKHGKGTMEPDRIEKLRELGFQWKIRKPR